MPSHGWQSTPGHRGKESLTLYPHLPYYSGQNWAVVTHRLCPLLSDSAVERIPTGTNHRNVRKRARGDVPGIYISCMPLYCALA